VRASAELPVFHSMLPGSAMVGLSTAMRRRVSAISGARNRLLDIGDACFGSARNPLVSWPAAQSNRRWAATIFPNCYRTRRGFHLRRLQVRLSAAKLN
jgi:hypothetical protein